MAPLIVLLFAVLGCGRPVDCSQPSNVLARASVAERAELTCHEASWAVAWIEVLAGRGVPSTDRREALEAVREAFEDDPRGTRSWLAEIRKEGLALSSRTGLEGAEARARRVWEANEGRGLIGPAHDGLWGVQKRTLAVWSTDDEEKLALTEADIESWIRYASLCREVQQGGPLRISVADRVTVYRMVRERFDSGSRSTQVALSSMGAVWPRVTAAWPAVAHEQQQKWVEGAPLPGPMTATSLGYAEAIFQADVEQHARALLGALGSLTVGPTGPMWAAEVPPS